MIKDNVIKDNVLEKIRHLSLTIENKIKLAPQYLQVTVEQKQAFKLGINEYQGRINKSFEEKLYDRFVYALFVKDLRDGQTMYEFLLASDSGFVNKRPSSFSL